MKILVCDDQMDGCEMAVNLIPSEHDVHGLYGQDLKEALRELFNTVSRLGTNDVEPIKPNQFADFDAVILDNDLSVLEFEGAMLSAETMIGYIRASTDIPYVVSLNKNSEVDFDMRYLFGDYQSLADLAVNTRHLECSRLWGDVADDSFAPWYWPGLPRAVERRRKQVDFVREHLEVSIWSELAVPELVAEHLSKRAQAALGGPDSQYSTTFREFFDGTHALLPRTRKIIGDRAGRDDVVARAILSRIVAADVDRWVRRDLLGPQDMLIDLPHLIARMPYLLGDNASDVGCWNSAIQEMDAPFGMDPIIYAKHVRSARFDADIWVPSPSFWWPNLNSDEELFDLFMESEKWPSATFCEDISKFLLMDGEAEIHEIEVEMESSWPRRHVARVPGRQYSPPSRFV